MKEKIKNFITQRNGQVFATFFIASLLSLASAYFVELILKHKPCELCLYQRIPFFIIIIISGVGLLSNCCIKFSKIVILLSLVFNLVLSGYHSGIEHGVFAPLHPCIHQNIGNEDSLLSQNSGEEEVPTCEKPAFFVFGLSMAEWNFIWNLSLIVVLMMLSLRSRQMNR